MSNLYLQPEDAKRQHDRYTRALNTDLSIHSFDGETLLADLGSYFAVRLQDGSYILLHAFRVKTIDELKALLQDKPSLEDIKTVYNSILKYVATGVEPKEKSDLYYTLMDLRVVGTKPDMQSAWNGFIDTKANEVRVFDKATDLIEDDQRELKEDLLTEGTLLYLGDHHDPVDGHLEYDYSSAIAGYKIVQNPTDDSCRVFEIPASKKLRHRYTITTNADTRLSGTLLGSKELKPENGKSYSSLEDAQKRVQRTYRERALKAYYIGDPYDMRDAGRQLFQNIPNWYADVVGFKKATYLFGILIKCAGIAVKVGGSALELVGEYLQSIGDTVVLSSKRLRAKQRQSAIQIAQEIKTNVQKLGSKFLSKAAKRLLKRINLENPDSLTIPEETGKTLTSSLSGRLKGSLLEQFDGKEVQRGGHVMTPLMILADGVKIADVLKDDLIEPAYDFRHQNDPNDSNDQIDILQRLMRLRQPGEPYLGGIAEIIPGMQDNVQIKTIKHGSLNRTFVSDQRDQNNPMVTVYIEFDLVGQDKPLPKLSNFHTILPRHKDDRPVLKLVDNGRTTENGLPDFQYEYITREEMEQELATYRVTAPKLAHSAP